MNEIIWRRYVFHGIALSLLMGPKLKWDLVRTAQCRDLCAAPDLIRAYENAPPSTLAPFSYVQLVWATGLSWLISDHVPDAVSLAGMAVIVGAGFFAVWMQRRKMRADEEGIATD